MQGPAKHRLLPCPAHTAAQLPSEHKVMAAFTPHPNAQGPLHTAPRAMPTGGSLGTAEDRRWLTAWPHHPKLSFQSLFGRRGVAVCGGGSLWVYTERACIRESIGVRSHNQGHTATSRRQVVMAEAGLSSLWPWASPGAFLVSIRPKGHPTTELGPTSSPIRPRGGPLRSPSAWQMGGPSMAGEWERAAQEPTSSWSCQSS